jgi:hypothetical protein
VDVEVPIPDLPVQPVEQIHPKLGEDVDDIDGHPVLSPCSFD